MKIYTIIGGVNGAGKSSLTGALKEERRDLGVIIDVDKIAANAGISALEAGKIALQKIEDCLAKEICFTQETTLSGYRTIKTIKKAREKGYYIRLYYIGLDTAQESVSRIKNRVQKGGHNIPTQDVIRRFESRFDCLINTLPYCDEVVFFDNNNGFTAVGEYANGELSPKGEYRPKWLCELMEKLK